MCSTVAVVEVLNHFQRVDFVALDGDQARAGVRRLDLQLDLVARRDVGLLERDLQLGVLLQLARQVAVAGDRVLDALQLVVLGVAQHQREVARPLGRQRALRARRGDLERLRRKLDLLASPIRTCRCRCPAASAPRRTCARTSARCRPSALIRLPLGAIAISSTWRSRAAAQVRQIAVGLVADQVRQRRHHRPTPRRPRCGRPRPRSPRRRRVSR